MTLPHTRGGVPQFAPDLRSIRCSSPHTWGCPYSGGSVGSFFRLFPTHVGVSPLPVRSRLRVYPLPHTRGGVPNCYMEDWIYRNSSPHTWGCPYLPLVPQWVSLLFPTHVGVSLLDEKDIDINKSLPHTRGGVPYYQKFKEPGHGSSPHVGVSLLSVNVDCVRIPLPHTRGGVPGLPQGSAWVECSSPHTWGCPYGRIHCGNHKALFPTHVGVSPDETRNEGTTSTLPHTRGGVPTAHFIGCLCAVSSPHTWGCPH